MRWSGMVGAFLSASNGIASRLHTLLIKFSARSLSSTVGTETQKRSIMENRGALIVLEGCDRCGKSTQCKQLVDVLNAEGIKAELWRYPERSTAIGQVISDYLSQKIEMEDHAVHLLFSANRWESVPRMKELLNSGTTLVVDRYAYSGVAFTAAKEGFSLDWCKQPDIGLPQPDLVMYLTLNIDVAAGRGSFGEERYERTDFQQKVAQNFQKLKEAHWKVIDANRTIEEIHKDIRVLTNEAIDTAKHTDLGNLWTSPELKENILKRKSVKTNAQFAKNIRA